MKNEPELVPVSVYKEPLREVEGGFGFMGVLLMTPSGDKIQCHACGGLYLSLQAHSWKVHKLRAADYKAKYGLERRTALISETLREHYKKTTQRWIASLSPEELDAYRRQAKEGRKNRGSYQPKIRLETRNKRGTCPDQLLAKIQEVAKMIGETPSKHEFITVTGTQRYVHLIYQTFGSWKAAVKLAGLEPRVQRQAKSHRTYSRMELLGYLERFAKETGKIPTATDFRRGYLPDYSVYIRWFGSIESAREEAGVYQYT